jgi:hypothetical protein
MTGLTRRARAAGGRANQITVWLSDEERSAVEGAAERAGMAPGAWLGEFGVRAARLDSPVRVGAGAGGGGAAALELMALQSELLQSRRVLTNIGGNLNDVARHANSTGALHAATAQVQALVARVVTRVEDAVARVDTGLELVLGGPVRRIRTGPRPRRAGHRGQSGQAGGHEAAGGQPAAGERSDQRSDGGQGDRGDDRAVGPRPSPGPRTEPGPR